MTYVLIGIGAIVGSFIVVAIFVLSMIILMGHRD